MDLSSSEYKRKNTPIREVAQLYGYSKGYLSYLCRTGKVAGKYSHNEWSVDVISLDRFIQEQAHRKEARARALAHSRSLEYRDHQEPAAKQSVRRFVSPSREIERNEIGSASLFSKYAASAAALVVLAFGATVANTTVISSAAERAALTIADVAFGFEAAFGGIPSEVAENIANAENAARENSARAASRVALASAQIAPPLFSEPDLSALSMALGEDGRSRTAPKLGTSRSAFPTTFSSAPVLTVADVRAAAEFLSSPPRVVTALANTHAALGEKAYAALALPFSAYRSLIEASGEGALALAVSARDAFSETPRLISRMNLALGTALIDIAHAAVRADVWLAYATADAAPRAAGAAVLLAGETGDLLAHTAARAPALAATLYRRATEAPAVVAPAIAQAVFDAEYAAGTRFIASADTVTSGYFASLTSAGALAYESVQGTKNFLHLADSALALAPSALENSYLGTLGKAALALQSSIELPESVRTLLAATVSTLNTGEKMALATYETIQSFFDRTLRALAFLFGPSSNLALPTGTTQSPAATSTKVAVYSSFASTTIVQGVSADYVNVSLASLRSDLLAVIKGIHVERSVSRSSQWESFGGDISYSRGNVGIGIEVPLTSLHIDATDGLILPVGTTAERPSANLPGIIRYNSTNTQFEGYNGITWGSLGGVIDTDQDTSISAENSPGANNDELKFFTAGSLRAIITASGNVGIGTSSPYRSLSVNGSAVFGGDVRASTITATSSLIANSLTLTTALPIASGGTATTTFYDGGVTFFNSTLGTLSQGTAIGDFFYDVVNKRLGLGTTSPWAQLSVNPNGITGPAFAIGSSTATNFIVTNGGSVGIGTSSPSSALAVSGNVMLDGTTGAVFTGAGSGITFTGSGNHDITAPGGTLRIGTNTIIGNITALNNTVSIGDAGTRFDKIYANEVNASTLVGTLTGGNLIAETFTINSDNATADAENGFLAFERGSVTPNALLTWNSADSAERFEFNQPLYIENASASTTITTLDLKAVAGQIVDIFRIASSSGANYFNITGGGLVGIGTSSPYAALSVAGEIVGGYFTATTTTASIFPYASTTAITASGSAYFATAGGNVGIGTVTPEYPLEIVRSQGSDTMLTVSNQFASGNASALLRASVAGATGYLGSVASTHAFPALADAVVIIADTDASGGVTLSARAAAPIKFLTNAGATDLNERMRIDSTGNVGIGTTSPYRSLSVNGSGVFSGGDVLASTITATSSITANSLSLTTALPIASGGTATTTFYDGGVTFFNSTLGTLSQGTSIGDFFYDVVNKRLGLGTSSPVAKLAISDTNAWAGPGYYGSLVISDNNAVGAGMTFDETGAGGRRYSILSTGNSASAGGGKFGIFDATAAAYRVVLDSTGQLGIGLGNASPAATLDIASTSSSGYTDAFKISATKSDPFGTGMGIVFYSSVGDNIATYNSGRIVSAFDAASGYNNGRLTFQTPTGAGTFTDVMSLKNGNVGIGTTSPWGQLSVNPNGITGPAFVIGSSTATKLIVTNGGNVGIGNVAPDVFLKIGDSITPTDKAYISFGKRVTASQGNDPFIGQDSTDGIGNDLGLGTRSTSGGINFYAGNINPFNVFTSTSLRMRINNDGNVGIGTTSPYAKLSVVGEIVGAYFTATTTSNSTFPNLVSTNSTTTNATTTNLAVSGTASTSALTVSNNATIGGTLAVTGAASLASTLSAGTTTSTNLVVTNTSTSTFTGGLQTSALNVTSTSASSTFANGINVTSGCLAENGICVNSAAVTLTAVRTYTSGTNVAYTPPSNAAYIVVETIGGGGGGGGGNSTNTAGGGGGGGGYAQKFVRSPSGTYYYTVGAGGTGATGDNQGGAAGASCFGTNATACTTPLAQGSGGTGGTQGVFGGAGGAGGAAPTGDVTLRGSAGASGSATSQYPFATGGSAARGGGGGDNAGTSGYGGGGSGTSVNGTAGSSGIIIVSEYTSAVTSSSIGTSLTAVRTYTSGTNTSYSPPSNIAYIVVETWGGGGGGGGGGNGGSGGAGGQTCFGTNTTACTSPTLSAAGGGGGHGNGVGGAGGTGSGGDINLTGGSGGGNYGSNAGSVYNSGGVGGSSPRGGGGGNDYYGSDGTAGGSFGGGGGGGGTIISNTNAGAGGGAGGYSQKMIASPSGAYYYTIGAAGTAGTAGASSTAGGAGGAGGVVIYEYTYSGLNVGTNGAGTTGQLAYYAAAGQTLTATSSLFLAATGNVGIGTTSPVSILNIEGSNPILTFSGLTGGGVNQTARIDTGPNIERLHLNTGSTDLRIVNNANNANLVTVLDGGNVGIGTTTPMSTLSVSGGFQAIAVGNTSDALTGISLMRSGGGNEWNLYRYGSSASDRFCIGQSGLIETFCIATSGNVGIGTTTVTTTGTRLGIGGGNILMNIGTSNQISDFSSFNYGLAFEDGTLNPGNGPGALITATRGTAYGADLQFVTRSDSGSTAVERMRITREGNVGINNTSPASYSNSKLVVGVGNSSNISFATSSGSSGGAGGFQMASWYNSVKMGYIDSELTDGTPGNEASLFKFATIGSGTLATRMTIGSAGNVGIGTVPISGELLSSGPVASNHGLVGRANTAGYAGAYALNSSNSATGYTLIATNTGASVTCEMHNTAAFTCSSDERLKSYITPISGALDKLSQIEGVSFRWTKSGSSSPEHLGVIAQDIAAVFPEVVTKIVLPGESEADSYYGVEYTGLIAPIIQGINELNSRTAFIESAYGTSTPSFNIDGAGNVGIGTTAPSHMLDVAGDIGAIAFVNTSTRSLKTDITYLSASSSANILNQLKDLQVATYHYSIESQDAPLRIGFIAEDAQTAAPEILSADGKGVDLYKLATFTLAGVQVLADKFDAQDARLTSLETRIAAIESGAISSASGTLSLSTTSLASALSSFGILVRNGLAQFGTLIFDQFVAATNSAGTSSAGTVVVLGGNTTAQVNNAYVASSTKVFVTFNSPVTGSWYVSDKQAGSFRVILSEPQDADVSFDYFLIQTEGQATTTMAASTDGGPSVDYATTQTAPATQTTTTATATTTETSTTTPSSSSGDTTPPVVTLIGDAAIEIPVGGTFSDPGATATDDLDGDLTAQITVSGTVDTATAGLYSLTYTATDAAGNTGSVSRVVTVTALTGTSTATTTTTTDTTTAPTTGTTTTSPATTDTTTTSTDTTTTDTTTTTTDTTTTDTTTTAPAPEPSPEPAPAPEPSPEPTPSA